MKKLFYVLIITLLIFCIIAAVAACDPEDPSQQIPSGETPETPGETPETPGEPDSGTEDGSQGGDDSGNTGTDAPEIPAGTDLREALDTLNGYDTFTYEYTASNGDSQFVSHFTLAPNASFPSAPIDFVWIEYEEGNICSLYYFQTRQSDYTFTQITADSTKGKYEKYVCYGETALEQLYDCFTGELVFYGPSMIAYLLADMFPEDEGFNEESMYAYIADNYSIHEGWYTGDSSDWSYRVVENSVQLYDEPELFSWSIPTAEDNPEEKYAAAYEQINDNVIDLTISSDTDIEDAVEILSYKDYFRVTATVDSEPALTAYGKTADDGNIVSEITFIEQSGDIIESLMYSVRSGAGYEYGLFTLKNGGYTPESEYIPDTDQDINGYNGSAYNPDNIVNMIVAGADYGSDIYGYIRGEFSLDSDGWYKSDTLPTSYKIDTDCVSVDIGGNQIFTWHTDYQFTPMGAFMKAYTSISDKIITDTITAGMPLQEAVEIACRDTVYDIYVYATDSSSGETITCHGTVEVAADLSTGDVLSGAAVADASYIAYYTGSLLTELQYFTNVNGNYTARTYLYDESTGKYTETVYTGAEAAKYGSVDLYPSALAIMMSGASSVPANEQEWNELYAQIDSAYTPGTDDWYVADDADADILAYKVEDNAITVRLSSNGDQSWVKNDGTTAEERFDAVYAQIENDIKNTMSAKDELFAAAQRIYDMSGTIYADQTTELNSYEGTAVRISISADAAIHTELRDGLATTSDYVYLQDGVRMHTYLGRDVLDYETGLYHYNLEKYDPVADADKIASQWDNYCNSYYELKTTALSCMLDGTQYQNTDITIENYNDLLTVAQNLTFYTDNDGWLYTEESAVDRWGYRFKPEDDRLLIEVYDGYMSIYFTPAYSPAEINSLALKTVTDAGYHISGYSEATSSDLLEAAAKLYNMQDVLFVVQRNALEHFVGEGVQISASENAVTYVEMSDTLPVSSEHIYLLDGVRMRTHLSGTLNSETGYLSYRYEANDPVTDSAYIEERWGIRNDYDELKNTAFSCLLDGTEYQDSVVTRENYDTITAAISNLTFLTDSDGWLYTNESQNQGGYKFRAERDCLIIYTHGTYIFLYFESPYSPSQLNESVIQNLQNWGYTIDGIA